MNDAPGTWTGVGPTNIGGRVTAVAVDPHDPARVWIGAAAGGVFLTEDEGASFVPVFDGGTALSIGSIAVHPSDSNTVYVGTGEDNGAGYTYDGEGIFKTTDGGATWSNVGLAGVRRIGRVAVDPSDGDRVFAAAGGDWFARNGQRGIYRSLDGGATWERVLYVADDAGGIDLAIDPLDPNRVFASVWQRFSDGYSWYTGGPASGIYRSTDGGDTWTRLGGGLPTEDMGKIGLALAPSDPEVVYANIIAPAGTLQGVYRSTDGGDTWERRDRGSVGSLYSSFGYYFAAVRVDPLDPDTVYVLDIRLLRSGNGGKTFGSAGNGAHVDWHDLVVEPAGRLVGGNDGGFYVRQDDGSPWVHSDGLAITQFYDLGIDARAPERRFAGSQDNGTLRTVTGGAADWHEVLSDDGLQCEVDPSDSNRVYASKQYGRLYRSTDGGAGFTPATDGIDPTERVNWNAPLALDPANPGTIYTGTTRVYRSTDAMVSWQPVSGDLTGSARVAGSGTEALAGRDHTHGRIRRTVTAIEVSPVDSQVVWAGTADGNVWVTENGGTGWTHVQPPGPAYWVTDIEADPRERGTAVLTVSGYRLGDRAPYVRVTRDLGATWEEAAGNLPQVPANTVVFDSDWIGRWFVGNDLGVYVTDDEGRSWSAMRGGMPYVVTLDLYHHDPSGALYAATHGRSIFRYDLAQLGPADGDGDGIDNNLDCAIADPGAFAAPGEIENVLLAQGGGSGSELSWDGQEETAGPGTVYDVARGALSDLRSSGSASGSVGIGCGLGSTALADPEVPAAGDGFFYLVRGRNACGTGGWGDGTAGTPRSTPACP